MVEFGTGSDPSPKRVRVERYFNRAAMFAAMLCAAVAVWIGYTGRATPALALLAVITMAVAYSLLWMLGRIIGGVVGLRDQRRAAPRPRLRSDA
jgi:hypothetical protein